MLVAPSSIMGSAYDEPPQSCSQTWRVYLCLSFPRQNHLLPSWASSSSWSNTTPIILHWLYHGHLSKPKLRCIVCATTRPTPPRLSTQLKNRLITAPTASKARRIASRRTLNKDATPGTSQPLGQRSAWSYILSSNFAPHVSQNTYNILLHSFTAVATQLYGIYMWDSRWRLKQPPRVLRLGLQH